MSSSRLQQAFPGIDEITEWYLTEIVYCLQRYLGFSDTEAYEKLFSWQNLRIFLEDDAQLLQTESGFYWAMALVKGFDFAWWDDPSLSSQYLEYAHSRHHPPR